MTIQMLAFNPLILPLVPVLLGAGAGAVTVAACTCGGSGKKKAKIAAPTAKLNSACTAGTAGCVNGKLTGGFFGGG